MGIRARLLFGMICGLLLPAVAQAQATITGAVRDGSGAVLPGVTVEAASPALIEKVRTAVTDGTGQYRIQDLRPGLYTVTFSLTGFSTVRREDVELTGSFVATISAELRVACDRGDRNRDGRDADQSTCRTRAASGSSTRRSWTRSRRPRASTTSPSSSRAFRWAAA